MKRYISLIILIFLCIEMSYSQNIKITGIVKDISNTPIVNTHLILYNLNDTLNAVKTAVSDQNGYYSFEKISKGSYKLVATNIQYNKSVTYIQNLNKDLSDFIICLEDRDELLGEVTVTAKQVIREFDRQVIFPGKQEKEISANGVDLIDRLYLDKVYINKTDNSINSLKGGKVQLRINGAPADETDFMNIDPKLVTRVEYHDRPSLRYGDTPAVIDFYVKRFETGGRGNLYLNNCIDGKALGTGRGGLTINHKKSEFSISGFYSYLNLRDRYQLINEKFYFDDGIVLSRYKEGEPAVMKERIYTTKASYSYYDTDNILFTASLFYDLYETPNTSSKSKIFQNGSTTPSMHMIDSVQLRESKPSFELYFQKNLPKKQLVAFDIVGTYMYTSSYESYHEYDKTGSISDYLTSISGNKYSVIAEGFYEKGFKRGRLNAGVKETAAFADNTYTGTYPYQSNMDQYTTTAYIQWYGGVKKLSYSVGAGVTSDIKIQKSEKVSDLRFYPVLNLGYRVSNDINLYYNGRVNVRTPQLGNLNNVQISKDDYLILAGNPKLKSETTYSNTLGLGLYKRNLILSMDASYNYSVNPMLNSTTRQDNKFIAQIQNGEYSNVFGISGFLRWNVVPKFINVYSRFGYNYRQNVTDNYKHSFNAWMLDAGLDAMYKDFTLGINTHKDFDFLNSETKLYKYFGLSFSLFYKWKNLKVGTVVRKSLNSYLERTVDMNQYAPSETFTYMPSSNTDVRFTLSWSFDFGRKHDSGEQRLYNQDLIKGVLK